MIMVSGYVCQNETQEQYPQVLTNPYTWFVMIQPPPPVAPGVLTLALAFGLGGHPSLCDPSCLRLTSRSLAKHKVDQLHYISRLGKCRSKTRFLVPPLTLTALARVFVVVDHVEAQDINKWTSYIYFLQVPLKEGAQRSFHLLSRSIFSLIGPILSHGIAK